MFKTTPLKYASLAIGFYLAIFFQAIYPIFISLIFCDKFSKKNFIYFIFLIFFVLSIAIVDIYSSIQFFLYFLFLIMISENFDRLDLALKYFSWITLFFLIYSIGLENININSGRYWKILPNGYELNPNFLGLIAGISFIYFFKYGKILISVVPFIFLMVAQSRSAILLTLIFILMSQRFSVFKILTSLIGFWILVIIVDKFGFLSRFTEEGNNGRIDRYESYLKEFNNSFPLVISSNQMNDFKNIYGNLDNLYLNLILRFGLGAFFFLFFIFYKAVKNKVSLQKKAMLFAIIVHGFLEPGFFGTYFLLTLMAISISKDSLGSCK